MGPTNLARIAIALERIADRESDTAKIEAMDKKFEDAITEQAKVYKLVVADHCGGFAYDLGNILNNEHNEFIKAQKLRELVVFWSKKAEELRNGEESPIGKRSEVPSGR